MAHVHLERVARIDGFATATVRPGEHFDMLVKGGFSSDDPHFHRYMSSITALLLSPAHLLANTVHSFVAVLHQDQSADLFINDFVARIEVQAKENVHAGAMISYSQIADIRRLDFPEIKFKKDDRVVLCLKCGWRFALYFDLSPGRDGRELNVDNMEKELGTLYRRISYHELYELLSSEERFRQMTQDGWFPFLELLGRDLDDLLVIYSTSKCREDGLASFERRFTPQRIAKMTERWWRIRSFEQHKHVLEAGIAAYQQNTPAGDVLCIKTLLSEIEGILRDHHFHATGIEASSVGQATDPLRLLANELAESLSLPRHFLTYLQAVVFAPFDVPSGKIPMSRHSAGHGVAKPEQYTHRRALQVLLTLDQIAHYIVTSDSDKS